MAEEKERTPFMKLNKLAGDKNDKIFIRLASGFGLGAAAMYLFDSRSGKRRRAILQDKFGHLVHETRDATDLVFRDAAHRLTGYAAITKSSILGQKNFSDDILIERVRSILGRTTSHPHSIEVHSQQGKIILKGDILKQELEDVLSAVSSVRGVKGLDDQLKVHHDRDITALQGGRSRSGSRPELLQQNWSPSLRALMGILGAGLSIAGFKSTHRLFKLGGFMGAGIFFRAVTNTEIKKLLGIANEKITVNIHKTMNIHAPIEKVFDFWSKIENFPQIMPDVREVKKIKSNVYRWNVTGPFGVPITWDSEITKLVTNDCLSWKSVAGSIVQNTGRIQFQKNEGNNTTKVDIDIFYTPPGAALGHAIGKLLRSDPRHKLNQDLMRVKSLFEVGKVNGVRLNEENQLQNTKAS